MIYILLVQWPHLGILPLLTLMCFPFEHFLPRFSSKSAGSLQVAASATELCDMIDTTSTFVLSTELTVWVHGFFTPLLAFQHIAGSVFGSCCESSVCEQFFTLFDKLRLLTTLSHMVKTLHMQWHHSFCLDPLENSEAAATAHWRFYAIPMDASTLTRAPKGAPW